MIWVQSPETNLSGSRKFVFRSFSLHCKSIPVLVELLIYDYNLKER